VLSCLIIATKPKVIAELVFESKEGADNVVDTLNNQNVGGPSYILYGAIISNTFVTGRRQHPSCIP